MLWHPISGLAWRGELRRARRRRSTALQFALSGAHLFSCAIKKLIARRNFIHQAETQSSLRRIKFAFQNHFSGFFHADQPRQPRATAPRWNQAKCRFWKSHPRRWIIRGNAIIARQCHLITAAGRRAMDRSYRRDFQIGEAVEDSLPFGNKFAHLSR